MVQSMPTIIYSFDLDDECWRVYDYEAHARVTPVHAVKPGWEYSGGVDDSGYIWADDRLWTIDTPEKPHSILALFYYRQWRGAGSLDLRDAEVSVHLRGDGLDLKGGQCFFWALAANPTKRARWHLTSRPLDVHDGHWGAPQSFTLTNDEALWHRSFIASDATNVTLDDVLGECCSYGFSFVGFAEKVTGRFALDELCIRTLR